MPGPVSSTVNRTTASVAEHPTGGLVDVREAAVEIREKERVGRELEQVPPARLGTGDLDGQCPQRLFALAAVGDVDGGSDLPRGHPAAGPLLIVGTSLPREPADDAAGEHDPALAAHRAVARRVERLLVGAFECCPIIRMDQVQPARKIRRLPLGQSGEGGRVRGPAQVLARHLEIPAHDRGGLVGEAEPLLRALGRFSCVGH